MPTTYSDTFFPVLVQIVIAVVVAAALVALSYLIGKRVKNKVKDQPYECGMVPVGDARPALERFYRRAARAEITPRLDRATALVGSRYEDMSIRGQRTRWGSCSAGGHMSFNWRLLLAPERVLEYVVWHEVCHLEILDHSPRFWALLERRWPGYREDRQWLSRHGATLVL